MAKRQSILTNLIGQSIWVIEHNYWKMKDIPFGSIGEIRSVYYDKDGNIAYSVEIHGRLFEAYDWSFTTRIP